MRATLLNGPGDISVAEVEDPRIVEPTDAVVRLSLSCVCGSDLHNYRGRRQFKAPQRIGHEFCGVVSEVGDRVTQVKVGDFVVGPFFSCCNKCDNCRAGFQSACRTVQMFADGCQAESLRVPQADGTLVTVADPAPELIPSLLACSDVMGTGWHAAKMANVGPGQTVAVVGDGAVGLCGVIAAKQLGAERIIISSRYADRSALARDFGATDVLTERGEEFADRVRELTDGRGADAVLECVGTEQALLQACATARPGSIVGFVGVPVGVKVELEPFFRRNIGLRGGMAPVREYLPELIELVRAGTIDPGRVFDVTMPLAEVAEAYKAMDERRAIKVALTV
ncbi:IMP dehydrogenase [Enemella dayhoffiae]|uniref:IMP dehydrogenase n=1 Tax=Enemella dayhoffiae TaxID=2016507 RepID=A0A255GZU0_9ACTN|nr:alcohol dehydrogenase catalytic domain-containing protein [Enemella dayhoffiae]OYO20962.1 IMP dehydrogenase [Enemella dayhoffiae]